MSSQGPSDDTPGNGPPFAVGPSTGSPSSSTGYAFTTASIRDGSDWTAYKKQLLVFKESKTKFISDPWFARGNDYRLQFLLGKYKQPTAGTCTTCSGGAFNTGPTS